jgi:hypothetical protein
MDALVLEQFAQQSQRSAGIAPLLDQHVQNFAFIVDRTPKPHPFAADLHDHFVQVPSLGRLVPGSAEISSEEPAKLE